MGTVRECTTWDGLLRRLIGFLRTRPGVGRLIEPNDLAASTLKTYFRNLARRKEPVPDPADVSFPGESSAI